VLSLVILCLAAFLSACPAPHGSQPTALELRSPLGTALPSSFDWQPRLGLSWALHPWMFKLRWEAVYRGDQIASYGTFNHAAVLVGFAVICWRASIVVVCWTDRAEQTATSAG
jgi:hypothetical protein